MGDIHYLDSGIYTVPDVAHLVRASQAQVRGWVGGYANSRAAPIVVREYESLGWRVTLSFKNLIEALFIKCFADEGFSIQAIRTMAEEARKFFDDPHPFARDILFKTDGQQIFAEFLNRVTKKTELYNLKRRNWALNEIMQQFLKEPPQYHVNGYARIWYPRQQIAPHVLLNPAYAFGQPVMDESGIPTRTLFDALRAENGDYKTIARWYEVTEDEVREAERFEKAA